MLPFIPQTIVLPDNADFAWVNQGSATVTVLGDGRIHLYSPQSSAANLRIRVKTAPGSPWTLSAGFQWVNVPAGGGPLSHAGILLRESSTGRLVFYGPTVNGNIVVQYYISPTATGGDVSTEFNQSWNSLSFYPFYLRIVRTGGTLSFWFSPDGEAWLQIHSETDTDFLTSGPDQYGHNISAHLRDVTQNLFHWVEA